MSPDRKNKVGYIAIDQKDEAISQATWLYVHKALETYKELQPSFILLKLNTPGGEVFAAQKISDALKEIDIQNDIPVVCFIDNWAISAGAMLAYSCRYIAVTKDASMGAAEPVMQAAGGQPQETSEKIHSAIRTDFANRASFFDRDPSIAEAMVDKDIILVQRRGKIVKLDNMNQVITQGLNPDILLSKEGKLLTLNAKQMMELGVANIFLAPTKLPPITTEEKEEGSWPFAKELLSTAPFFHQLKEATVTAYHMDFRTKFFSILMTPLVSSLLFLGLMMGIYMEVSSPGFGFFGSLALICLLLIVLSSFALEIGGFLELILVTAGITFFLIDLFLLPTFGLLGSFGLLLFIGGLLGLLIPGLENFSFSFEEGTFNEAGLAVLERLAWIGATFVVGLVLIALLARFVIPQWTPFQRLVLEGEQEGYTAGNAPNFLPHLGDTGTVLAPLRPAGRIEIGDKVYDVQSEGAYIDEGEKVTVSYIEGSRIFVKREHGKLS